MTAEMRSPRQKRLCLRSRSNRARQSLGPVHCPALTPQQVAFPHFHEVRLAVPAGSGVGSQRLRITSLHGLHGLRITSSLGLCAFLASLMLLSVAESPLPGLWLQ